MLLLSKLFTFLFLPPGIFIFGLFVAFFLVRSLKKIFFILFASFYFISTQFGSNVLLEPLEQFTLSDNIKPKAIVVLGSGVTTGGKFKASTDGFKREIRAVLLAKKTNLPIVFSGGGLGKMNESDAFKSDLKTLEKNFDFNATVYYERDSLNTIQNAQYTNLLFEQKGFAKEIYLVTSAYHMKRATELFKDNGFKVITKPADFKKGDSTYLTFLPKMGYLNNSYNAIHEYFGLLQIYLTHLQ